MQCEANMWKLSFSLLLFAVIAVSISRKLRLSNRYDRNDKQAREISDWKSLDQGIDPTIKSASDSAKVLTTDSNEKKKREDGKQ